MPYPIPELQMITKDEIISNLYDDPKLKKAVLKICNGSKFISDELHSEIILRLLEKDDQYILQRHNNDTLYATAVVIARNIVYNRSNRFNREVIKDTRKNCPLVYNSNGEPVNILEDILQEQQSQDDLAPMYNAFLEELPKLHYYPRTLLEQQLEKSVFDNVTGKWNHASIKDISDGANRTKYTYNAQAIRNGKKQLRKMIEKNIQKKELTKIL
ncbi:MAG: hypothetical protein ACTHMM_21290 [Agriterribacter sp.]